MRRLILAVAVLGFASLAAQDANAEACSVTTGVTRWSAVATTTGTAWSGAPCTAGAGDDFTIAGGDVEITGDIAVTTGSVTCSSGTLRIGSGAGVTFSGGTAGRAGVTISGTCTLIMDGQVVWSGRLGSTAITYAGTAPDTTATFTTQGAGSVAAVASATTDYFVFGDDDPTNVSAAITSPVQIGSGPPSPGYYRPTYPKWTWWDVTAVAYSDPLSTVTIATNAYGNTAIQNLPGGGTSPFTGTRQPALNTSTAITSMARTKHGLMTALTIDVDVAAAAGADNGDIDSGALSTDGDLGAQYVTVTTGACANRTYKIAYLDAAATVTPDVIYVWGDLTETCGATPEIVINYGWRAGDPVKLVRPAYIDGGNVARIDWSGGSIKANWFRFTNLFPGRPTGNAYDCNFCAYRTDASTQPTFNGSYLTNFDFAFPGMMVNGNATGAITFDNQNTSFTGYHYATALLDMSGLVIDRAYIHDQRLESTSGAEGVHGFLAVSSNGLNVTRARIARIGDDGIYWGGEVFTNTTQNQAVTLRQFYFDEAMSLSNSQQLTDINYNVEVGGTGSTGLYPSNYSATLSDVGGNCCVDGGLTLRLFNVAADRIVQGGTSGIPGGLLLGGLTTAFTASTIDAGASNVVRDSIIANNLGPTNNTNHLALNGNINDSIIGANLGAWGQGIQSPYSLNRTFVDLGTGNPSSNGQLFTRFAATAAGNAATTLRTTDSVVLAARAAGTQYLSGSSLRADSMLTNFDFTRSFFGVFQLDTSGFCDGATCSTTTDGSRTLTANGLTLTASTVNAGGVGMGDTGEGTTLGATITNACVETTGLATGVNVFGASRTATSLTSSLAGPDAVADLPISAFTAQPTNTLSVCGGSARPLKLGLSKFGPAHSMLGDGVAGNIGLFTTNRRLIQSVSSGGGGGGNGSCIGVDCGGLAQ